MALPADLQPNGAVSSVSGIEIRLTPGVPPSFELELWRAPDNGSGAPDTANAILLIRLPVIPAQGASYVDMLGQDDAFRHYRWRHIGAGYDAGTYTSWARGKPAVLPPNLAQGGLIGSVYPIMRSLQLTDGKYALKASDTVGKETDDDLFISSIKTVKVGTVASPSSITKTLRIPCAELVPQSDLDTWTAPGGSDMRPRTANVASNFIGAVVLPGGVTIIAVRFRGYRQTVNDTANCSFIRVENDATVTLATMTHATTGWATLSGSLTETVTASRTYIVQTGLAGVAAAADARYGWFEIDYTMPSYDKGY